MIWHHEQPENVAKELQSNLETGLSEDEALHRLEEDGHNRYFEKPTVSILKQVRKSLHKLPMVLIIIAALFLLGYNILLLYMTGSCGSLIEPLVLLLLPPIGHWIGALWQRHGTSKLHKISNNQTNTVKVLRGGEQQTISAADVVRGDVLFLEMGMIIPADCRLITAEELYCDEYVVSGEDTDIAKVADVCHDGITPLPDRTNMVYAGCGVSHGSGTAIVVNTAQSTEYALRLNDPNNQSSPLPGISKDIKSFERLVSLPIVILSAIILLIGVLKNLFDLSAMVTLVSPILVMAAAAIPTGLTVAAIVAMAMGMEHVVKRHAEVRDLSVMDTLSRVTVICADKTGSLTVDEKKPVSVFLGDTIEELTKMPSNRAQTLIRMATMCTAHDTKKTGVDNHLVANPTESAIIEYARDIGIERRTVMEETPRLASIPFDTARRCMSVVHLVSGRRLMVTMGAPETVFSYCSAGPIEQAEEAYRNLGQQALRVLAVAYKYVDETDSAEFDESQEANMMLVGLIALADQPRDDSIKAIAECQSGGIITVMMTGDTAETALAVGKQLGILQDDTQLLTAEELREMSHEEFDSSVGIYRVFARITPDDKERIVRAWQKRGATVAVMGNELADVPALQRADIGCATGAADCDMTRNEADLTLYDNNFSALVNSIKHARGIFCNIRKALKYTVTCSLTLIVATLLTVCAYNHVSLSASATALYLLFGMLCTMAICYESGDRHALHEKPRRGMSRLMPASSWVDTLWQGGLAGVCAFLAFDTGRAGVPSELLNMAGKDIEFGATTAFITLMLSRLFMMLATHHHDARSARFANRVMPTIVLIGVLVTGLLVVIEPLGGVFGLTKVGVSNWLLATAFAAIPAVATILVRFIHRLLTTVRRADAN
ncbi:MAG: cation-transporting P-type ATPase [Clostridia bacterium]|nr:cation-transporting P-type ATPase [Clostridia bacterium]